MSTFDPQQLSLTIKNLLMAIRDEQDPTRLRILEEVLEDKRVELAQYLRRRREE